MGDGWEEEVVEEHSCGRKVVDPRLARLEYPPGTILGGHVKGGELLCILCFG